MLTGHGTQVSGVWCANLKSNMTSHLVEQYALFNTTCLHIMTIHDRCLDDSGRKRKLHTSKLLVSHSSFPYTLSSNFLFSFGFKTVSYFLFLHEPFPSCEKQVTKCRVIVCPTQENFRKLKWFWVKLCCHYLQVNEKDLV